MMVSAPSLFERNCTSRRGGTVKYKLLVSGCCTGRRVPHYIHFIMAALVESVISRIQVLLYSDQIRNESVFIMLHASCTESVLHML